MANTSIRDFIRQAPKAENHLHIGGAIPLETAFELAKRKKIPLPDADPAGMAARFSRSITGLDSFVECFWQVSRLCETDEDYHQVVLALGRDARAQNIVYRELMLNYPLPEGDPAAFGRVVKAIGAAMAEAKRRYGVDLALIVDLDRTQPPELLVDYVRMCEPYIDIIDAIGLDSCEKGNPSIKHKAAFELAGMMGFYRTCHAGEDDGPRNIWQALDILCCDRIDHGIRCVEDPKLMRYLADKEYLLTVCPRSNVMLGVVPGMAHHPLKALMRQGIRCSLNSDDPTFFGSLVEVFDDAAETLELDEGDLIKLIRNSFRYSIKGQCRMEDFESWLAGWRRQAVTARIGR